MTEERTRKTQYEVGYEEAQKHALLVLSTHIDNYPGIPSSATLGLIGDLEKVTPLAAKISAALEYFGKRIAKHAKKEAAS